MKPIRWLRAPISSPLALALALACGGDPGAPPDDEAMERARMKGRTADDAARDFLPTRVQNYFAGMDAAAISAPGDPVDPLMDKRPPLPRELRDPVSSEWEILGRNTWMLWVGGNEGFWDWLSRDSLGFIDLLKLLDSRQRTTRFETGGLINEPDRTERGAPAEEDFGLWLDQPVSEAERRWRRCYVLRAFSDVKALAKQREGDCSDAAVLRDYGKHESRAYGHGPEAYEPARYAKYRDPASAAMAYALEIPPPEIYGLSSGVIGLRLFPNPNFDDDDYARWSAERYYAEEENAYWEDPDLERPYRVGMSCAFCHASYHPLKPPRDLANPGVENLSGNIGAQYLRIRSVFGNLLKEDDFVYHLLDSQPPGTVDTSLIASDNINNPNTMNAVFGVPQRVVLSLRLPKETLAGASIQQPSVWRHPDPREAALPGETQDEPSAPLRAAFAAAGLEGELDASSSNPRRVPRILLDGADSIGAWGALARVYLNIGTYWEQWNLLHEPVIGFKPQRPFRIDDAEARSVYWHATQLRVGPLRDYFLVATSTMPLLEAGDDEPAQREKRIDKTRLAAGRNAFARNCIMCHSSIQPAMWWERMEEQAARGELWDRDPGQWLRDQEYRDWAEAAVETEDFWRHNYLSTDFRVPVTLAGTNACRALGTNGMTGQMWEDFSSATYRSLPSVGAIDFWNPYKGAAGEDDEFQPRHRTPDGVPAGGGGPGYYRVPTLLSIWATAPFLHNNSLGTFDNDPSVKGRLVAFEDAMSKLLSPERRLLGSSYNGADAGRLQRDHGLIWRTSAVSYLSVPIVRLPFVAPLRDWIKRYEADPASSRWLAWARKAPWLPSAALLAVAGLALWRARTWKVRIPAVVVLFAAPVVGLVLYLLVGRLGELRVGPIPKGTPVNLVANLSLDQGPLAVLKAVGRALAGLSRIESEELSTAETQQVLREEVGGPLLEVNRCPDFVMDRGHAFPWFESMTSEDKRALIELLKTL